MRRVIFFLMVLPISCNVLALEIKSDAFKDKGYIPGKYSCDAQNFSPALSWSQVPEGTKSFALICDDPDAPVGTWVHWVIFNIPKDTTGLKENISQNELSSLGIISGINDFKQLGYDGPCPPSGKPHRYFFKLYALDTTLSLGEGATNKQVVEAMKGHILAEAETIGFYQRQQ